MSASHHIRAKYNGWQFFSSLEKLIFYLLQVLQVLQVFLVLLVFWHLQVLSSKTNTYVTTVHCFYWFLVLNVKRMMNNNN